MQLELFAIGVIIWSVFFDALRDGFLKSCWWKRHIFKWLQFYPPILFILIVHLGWQWWLILPIPSWIIWRIALRYVAKVNWPSMWISWLVPRYRKH
jgi:hypothetical protein